MIKKDIVEQTYNLNSIYASKGYTHPYYKSWFTKCYDKKQLVYIEKDKKVVAYACAYIFDDSPSYVNLVVVGVLPEYLGKGYGKKIVTKFKRKFKDKVIILNVKKENKRAVGFYKKIGFKIVPYEGLYFLMKNDSRKR
jgi:ribosomal protein S18 acetylase RimI-like enzyme